MSADSLERSHEAGVLVPTDFTPEGEAADERVLDLLARWESSGRHLTPQELCAERPELLPQVQRGIGRLRSVDRMLAAAGAEPEHEAGPPQVPGYQILGPLGRGGMGTVWRAVQLGTRRAVAVKLTGAGTYVSPRARLRFEREVELASRLTHPNIARVYDSGLRADVGGAAGGGTLFYAMELIDGGLRIDAFVCSRNLSRDELLELMKTVCRAVHHAHQLGVIHRDLKPSNILVDPEGRPHLLDFGLAKELWADASPQLTLDGSAAGTPAYMSPEQAAGETRRVGTGSDVYALGVILFQLLLGRLPHDTSGSSIAVMRRIAGEAPLRPRGIDPKLPRDLEAILLKALAREPEHRYASADAMADDLDRFVGGLPIRDARLGLRYVVGKLVRRHQYKLLTAACVLALVLGVLAWAYERVARARATSETQRAIAVAVNEFILGPLLRGPDPEVAQGTELSVRELLDRANAEVGRHFADQPLVEAAVRLTLARTYLNLGLDKPSEVNARRAASLRRRVLGADDPQTLAAESELAYVLEGWMKLDEALALQRDVYERRRQILGEDDPDTLMSLHRIGNVLAEQGKFEEAERHFRDTLEARRRVLGLEHPDTIWSMSDLGGVLSVRERDAEAEPLLREALDLRLRAQGPKHIDTLNAEYMLALVLLRTGSPEEADALLQRNLLVRREVYGPDHPSTGLPAHSLAKVRMRQRRPAEAIALAEEAFRQRRRGNGLADPSTMESLAVLVEALVAEGRADEAGRLLAEVEPIQPPSGERHRNRWTGAYAAARRHLQKATTPKPATSPAE